MQVLFIKQKQAGQGYDGRVFVFNPRATAIFSKSVVVGVTKKGYEKVLQRFYTSKRVKHDLVFSREWRLLESNLIKNIREGKLSKLSSKTKCECTWYVGYEVLYCTPSWNLSVIHSFGAESNKFQPLTFETRLGNLESTVF
jgi:hypothetical protein